MAKPNLVTRPEDVLPDGVERADVAGLTVRKGTVAAFLQNVRSWSDPATAGVDRDALARELVATVPALEALGVFDVFAVRDPALRALLGR